MRAVLYCLSLLLVSGSAGAVDYFANARQDPDQAGLFFDPSLAATDEEIRAAFKFVCDWNQATDEAGRFRQLVITHIGRWDPARGRAELYARELRLASNYLSCFDSVSLGLARIPGLEEEGRRESLVAGSFTKIQLRAAPQLLRELENFVPWRSPKFGWYIPLELELGALVGPGRRLGGQSVTKALGATLNEVSRGLRSLENRASNPKRTLWAPRIGEPFASSRREAGWGEQLTTRLKGALRAAALLSDVQLLDGSGQNAYYCDDARFCRTLAAAPPSLHCEEDTVNYFKVVAEAARGSAVRRLSVAPELFYTRAEPTLDGPGWRALPGFVPRPIAATGDVRRCLARAKIPLGASANLLALHRSFLRGDAAYRFHFEDMPEGHIAYGAVAKLAQRNLTIPCEGQSTRYCPDRAIGEREARRLLFRAKEGAWAKEPASIARVSTGALTRSALLRLVLEARGLSPQREGALRAGDVARDSEEAPYVLRAESLGLPLSCDEGKEKFYAERLATRTDFARWLEAAFGY